MTNKKLSLYLLLTFIVFAGITNAQKLENNKWEITVNSSLNFSYRQLIDKNNGAANEAIIQERNEAEIWKETMSFSTVLSYKIWNKLKVGSGLEFMNLGWKTRKMPLISLVPGPSVPEAVKYYQHFYFLGIPLNVEYEIPAGKVSSIFSIELVPSRLLAERYNSTVYYSDRVEHNTSSSPEEFKSWNLFSGLSIGGTYALSENAKLIVDLNSRLSIMDIIEAPISAKHVYCGLRIGYRTSF